MTIHPSSSDPGLDADALSTEEHVAAVGWIRTFTGKRVTPLDMKPEMVNIRDIAHALARICRYGGHVAGFVSVGLHSIEVAHMVAEDHPELALEALLHDAAEAYLGDLVRPLKKHPLLRDVYLAAEQRAETAISEVFGLRYPFPEIISICDDQRLTWEMENIRDAPHWTEQPRKVETSFLQYFNHLRKTR